MTDRPTREQILAEPAGRQMDAWVGEFVMQDNTEKYIWKRFGKPDTFQADDYGGPQHYSTDIAAAWQVVAKMRVQNKRGFLVNYLAMDDDEPFMAQVYSGDPMNSDFESVFASTAPLAICKAALLAVTEPE